MSHSPSVRLSARSLLIAGVSTAVVGTAAVTPVSAPHLTPATIAASVQMTAITSGLQAAIKNTYDMGEAKAQYIAELANFSLAVLPGLWWVAPSIPFTYHTAEPLVRAGVYASADMIGFDFRQLAVDINAGFADSAANARAYAKAWRDTLVPFPIPPEPPVKPSASVAPAAASVAAEPEATALAAAPQAASVTSPIESAIKNTYNAVEPWVAYGFELTQWALSFIPGVWWLAPGIDLAYFTIEPLVQAGVFVFADVLGLDFAQIGPDIQQGISTSLNNAGTYALAWLSSLIPLPPFPPFPPRPGAAVAPAASVRAAAAVTAPEASSEALQSADPKPMADADAPAPVTGTTPEPTPEPTPEAATEPTSEAATEVTTDTGAEANTPAPEAAAEQMPALDNPAPVEATADVDAPAAEAPAAVETPAADPAPQTPVRRGAHAPAAKASAATGDSAPSGKTERRGARSGG